MNSNPTPINKKTIYFFKLEIFVNTLINKWQLFNKKVPDFLECFKTK